MIYRIILSIPVGSSVETLTPSQIVKIGAVGGRWTKGGMPGTYPAEGQYLIDVLTNLKVSRAMLDALGLPLWHIVGCWTWDGGSSSVEQVEPFNEALYIPHLPVPLDPETGNPTGAPPTLKEVHLWAGWPICIGST